MVNIQFFIYYVGISVLFFYACLPYWGKCTLLNNESNLYIASMHEMKNICGIIGS